MKEGNIIAFKTKNGDWFTGVIRHYTDENNYIIGLIVPIEPQWYEDNDKTIYYSEDVEKIKLLE